MTVLVTGSRGRVGSALVDLLHTRGVAVRAASAAPEKLEPPPGVATVRCHLGKPETFAAALDSVKSVFLYAEPSHIGAFTEAAAAAGVEHIVLLSSNSVLAPDADNPIATSHLAVEQALTAATGATTITATFLRPGAFATNALQWSWAVKSGGAIDLPYPFSHADPLHEADIAEAALAVLTTPRLQGAAYELTGPESLTFTEQIETLSRAAGRDIEVNAVSRETWKAAMAQYLPGAFADSLLDYWARNDRSPVPLTRTVEELTGHPARSFAAWAREHAAAFTG
ncbi:NAD(P)H-binding protein [Streptomyces sp. ISL-100]|uniref:NmrA family NAD(P)-binding protein n=1 Tax=Streptomyces sp. ISL-100 TaxID=2819173 RepID=UPI001BEA3BA4|nr:NAD(P)H-binding protein [Streptomyces sp. ISL-100]MBT2397022.1 NmrA family NAD(P)-binding protein [Streptomyces sp. ISL-100]